MDKIVGPYEYIMKKTILRTALITLGISLVMAVAVFGIVSFCFPYVMMNFTASLGMKNISGDYAYQEFERSGSIDCLARSFIIAAEEKKDRAAHERFVILYGEDESEARQKFDEYCASYEVDASDAGNVEVSMRSYLLGLASRVKYRLAKTSEEKKQEVCEFALKATDSTFPQGNPVVYLAIEAVEYEDAAFCEMLATALEGAGFEANADYKAILKLLQGVQNT